MGGNPKNQIENIKKYNLKEVLNNYEGIIIGTSAGTMNQAKRVKYLDENNNLIDYDGIGLLDILIYPHQNINSLENLNEVLNVSKYGKIYCLPNESFIRLEENNKIIEGPYYIIGE